MPKPFFEGGSADSLSRAALDTLPLNIAILDTDGEILATNTAWREFATSNDATMQPDMVGVNYLDVCDDSDDSAAREAAEGIRAVMRGDRPVFELEYPCHSPNRRRWFLLRAARFDHDDVPYVSVAHVDVTERKRAQLEAERAADQLADERETLSLLNQIVRHDVRNDANVIAGWANLLAESSAFGERDELRRIEETAAQMAELTRTAANLSKTVIEGTADDLRPTNLTETLDLQIDKIRSSHGNRSKSVEIDDAGIPETDVWVSADEMLTAVFSNVLNNAVFHGRTEPVRIAVTVERDETAGEVAVRIADSGPGIPDEAKERVFGRGEKGLESAGTGLGLYLVDRLVERYDGDVWISDNTPDGTVVNLTFRRADAPTSDGTPTA